MKIKKTRSSHASPHFPYLVLLIQLPLLLVLSPPRGRRRRSVVPTVVLDDVVVGGVDGRLVGLPVGRGGGGASAGGGHMDAGLEGVLLVLSPAHPASAAAVATTAAVSVERAAGLQVLLGPD